MLARAGELPRRRAAGRSRSSGTACARSRYSRAGPAALRVAATCNDITARYPELARLNRALHAARGAARRRDRRLRRRTAAPSFGRSSGACTLDRRGAVKRAGGGGPGHLRVFDLLWLDGHSLMELPYAERRELLEELELERRALADARARRGERRGAARRDARAQGLEGVVAKRLDCPYEPGRRAQRLDQGQEPQRAGVRDRRLDAGRGRAARRGSARCWSASRRRRRAALRGPGRHRASTRTSSTDLRGAAASRSTRDSSPVRARGAGRRRGRAGSSRAGRRGRVHASGRADGMLRHPSFKGLRDKPAPRSCASDDAASARPRRPSRSTAASSTLTNLDKVLYPEAGFTKGDVIDYYARDRAGAAAAPRGPRADAQALPERRRGPGLLREARAVAPAGLGADRAGAARGARRSSSARRDDLPTLVWLAQPRRPRAAPVAGARRATLERPTMLVFDLDPGAPADDRRVLPTSALLLRGMFERPRPARASPRRRARRACRSTCRSTAGRHVRRRTKPFAKAVAELLETRGARTWSSRA